MVVVMAPDATDEQIDHVVERVESVGGEAFVSRGVVRTIIGLVGDIDSFHGLNLRSLPGVADVHRISDPFKLVSRQHHAERSTVWVGQPRPPGADRPGHVHLHRRAVRGRDAPADARGRRDGEGSRRDPAARAARSSRAPRRTPSRGSACAASRSWPTVRETTGLPIVTEVVDARDVPVVAEHADMLQVGTRNMATSGCCRRSASPASRCCSSAA